MIGPDSDQDLPPPLDADDECGGRFDHIGEADTSDSVTVLVCKRGRRATKRWRLDDHGATACEPYDAGYHFATERHPVTSLAELAALLDALMRRSRAFVIRGELLPHFEGTIGRRLAHDDANTGDVARYAEVPRRWVAHDLDKVPLDRAYDLRDPHEAREAVERLRRMLSIEWRRAACFVQLTASAGRGDPSFVSARLWYWLDRPVSREELEAWAKATHAPVDVAIYRTVQPHYTAAPIFVAPLTDPIPARAGMLDGDPVVWLRDYAPAHPPREERGPYVPRPRDNGSADRSGRAYARATLEAVARELAAAGEGDRHRTLFEAALRCGGLVPGRWLSRSEIHDELFAAARAAGLGRSREAEVVRTIDDAINAGERLAWNPPERSAA